MGLWWKNVDRVPVGGIRINGDQNAFSKANPLWRFQHKWIILRAETHGKPYFIFFDDGVNSMQYRKKITSEFFAVRIGQRGICFKVVVNTLDIVSVPIYWNSKCKFNWVDIYLMGSKITSI